MHEENCFITLTYREEELPENGSLEVRDWQLFVKRAREQIGKFRYFHCGEYGDRYGRPHYHAILFGKNFDGDRVPFKMVRGNMLYTSEVLEKLWTHGFATVGDMTFKSAAYVARYVMKRVTGPQQEEHYNGRKPEYVTMSRNKGLGSSWIKKYGEETYRDDTVVVNGGKMRPPKFYDGQYEIDNPEVIQAIKETRVKEGNKRESNRTPERLEVREQVNKAKMDTFKKRDIGETN